MVKQTVAIILAVAAMLLSAGLFNSLPEQEIGEVPAHIHTLYSKWLVKYGVLRTTPSERNYRLKVFSQTLDNIKVLRARYPETKFGLNHMSDMTLVEKKANFLGAKPMTQEQKAIVDEEQEQLTLPLRASFPAQAMVRTNGVRDQGRCGSCWAFTSAMLLESMFDGKVAVSTQYIMDCRDTSILNIEPCVGNNIVYSSFEGINKNGYKTESECRYRGRASSCAAGGKKIAGLKQTYVTGNEGKGKNFMPTPDFIKNAIANVKSAVGVIVNTNGGFFDYAGGLYNDDSCKGYDSDHEVTIIGYTPEHWLIQNSWGESWGEDGLMRVKYYEDMSAPKSCVCGGQQHFCELVYFYAPGQPIKA